MLIVNFIVAMFLMLLTICLVGGSLYAFFKWYVNLERKNESE